MRTLIDSGRQTLRALFCSPLALLILQAPDLVSDALLRLQKAPFALEHPTLFAVLAFPTTWVLTVLSMAATGSFLSTGSLRATFRALSQRGAVLVASGALVGVCVLVGLLVVLPGLYFLSIYLLVPFCLMENPRATVFESLAQSKRLSRPYLWPLMGLAVFLIALGIGLEEVQGQIQAALTSSWVSVPCNAALSLVLAATTHSFLYFFYVALRKTDAAHPG